MRATARDVAERVGCSLSTVSLVVNGKDEGRVRPETRARVLAVAVAFAAMTEPRAQRQPLGPSEALAELRRNSGSQFDPRVVEALTADLAEESPPAVPV